MIKTIKTLLSFGVLSLSLNAYADTQHIDWQTPGDNAIFVDTRLNQEWLTLDNTQNMTYNEVSAELGAGGQFEGWSIATRTDVEGLLDTLYPTLTFERTGTDGAMRIHNSQSGVGFQNETLFMQDYYMPLWAALSNGTSLEFNGDGGSWRVNDQYRTRATYYNTDRERIEWVDASYFQNYTPSGSSRSANTIIGQSNPGARTGDFRHPGFGVMLVNENRSLSLSAQDVPVYGIGLLGMLMLMARRTASS